MRGVITPEDPEDDDRLLAHKGNAAPAWPAQLLAFAALATLALALKFWAVAGIVAMLAAVFFLSRGSAR